VDGREDKVVDEVDALLVFFFFLLLVNFKRVVYLKTHSKLSLRNFAKKFWVVVDFVFVILKTNYSFNVEFLCESYA